MSTKDALLAIIEELQTIRRVAVGFAIVGVAWLVMAFLYVLITELR